MEANIGRTQGIIRAARKDRLDHPYKKLRYLPNWGKAKVLIERMLGLMDTNQFYYFSLIIICQQKGGEESRRAVSIFWYHIDSLPNDYIFEIISGQTSKNRYKPNNR
jgi:hypothetical protein